MKRFKRIFILFVLCTMIVSMFTALGVNSSASTSQLDVVFIIDTTGSMSGLSGIGSNIKNFDSSIKSSGLSARYALVEFKDITDDGNSSTKVHVNGSSNWFTDIDVYKSKVTSLSLTGGGDSPETVIDALEMARRLDMRESAAKLFVLITDTNYKINNRYGISSMSEEISLLKRSGVNCAVITDDSADKSYYTDLYTDTNGVWALRGTDFYTSLASLAKSMAASFDGTYIPGPVLPAYPESAHPYSNGFSKTWYYTHPGNITKLRISFSSSTYVESNYDYIYIYNGSGSLVGKYTGSSLAGKIIEISGGSFSISLTTDGSVTEYGFSITKIEATCSHNYVGYDSVVPTCTKEGKKVYICECGDRYEQVVAKIAHKFSTYVENNDGTCTVFGTKTAYCDYECGASDTQPGSLNPDNHSYTSSVSKKSTCTSEGETLYTCACGDSYTVKISRVSHSFTKYVSNNDGKCGVQGTVTAYCDYGCGKTDTKSDPDSVDGHVREWVEVVKPTCVSKGKQEYRCVNCNKVFSSVDIAISPGAHNKVRELITPATCQSTGREQEVCTLCDKVLGKYVIPKDESKHEMDWEVYKEATCTEDGVKEGCCIACGVCLDSEIIPATGHSYVADVRREASCVKVGKVVYTCHCGDTYTENPSIVPHKYTNYISNNDGNCTTKETKTAYCDYGCGNSDTITGTTVSDKHNYTTSIVREATCTKVGLLVYTCDCGKSYTENIAVIPHSYSEYVSNNDGDCTTKGTKTAYCDYGCGNSETIPSTTIPDRHNYVPEIISTGTCLKEGEVLYTCECGDSYIEKTKKAPHSFTVYKSNNDGNCLTDSTETSYCDYGCGETDVRVVSEAKGHVYTMVDLGTPTCTKEGKALYVCACGDFYIENIPALGHDYVETVIRHESCVENGEIVYTCSCGYSYTSITEKLPHKFTVYTYNNDGSCLTDSTVTAVCDYGCGEVSVKIIAVAEGHVYGSWTVEKEATATEEGLETRRCVACDSTEERIIAKTYENKFTDVKNSYWFASQVAYCVQKGYIAGMNETTFAPNGSLTRAQFVIMLAKLDGVDLASYATKNSGFADVKVGSWFHDAITWATMNSYAAGMSTDKFGPNEKVTRQQLAAFFYRYAQANCIDVSGKADLSVFPDASKVQPYAVEALQWAVDAGIISGIKASNGTINLTPNGNATRAQAAVMFMAFDTFRGIN